MKLEPEGAEKVMAQHTCYADSPDMPLTVSRMSPHRDGSEGQVTAVIVSDDRPFPTSGFGISAMSDMPNPMRGIWSEQYGNTCRKCA